MTTDFITLAEAHNTKCLTKIYHDDNSVSSYDDAASFKFREFQVSGVEELSALLTDIQEMKSCCVIRGKFVGPERAEKAKIPGTYVRQNVNLDEVPHHWVMFDIDKYVVDFGDPVHDPVDTIIDFIAQHLPPCFVGRSFHWQLSSSAGTKGKEMVLKAHLWFWLETPYTGAQLTPWAKAKYKLIDTAPFRRAQIHYTANPIFEEGVTDPVPVRSGLYRGPQGDSVPLVIDGVTLEQARVSTSGTGNADAPAVDMEAKDGVIGAYCRAFSVETVLLEHVQDEFAPGSTDRRWTWLNGGGTPEGVWIHDDGNHIGSSHHTWPCELGTRTNKWDLVRHFRFGHLDVAEDDLDQVAIANSPPFLWPSHLAMVEWAKSLPEVRDELAKEVQEKRAAKAKVVESLLASIGAAESSTVLANDIVPAVKELMAGGDLAAHEIAELETCISKRFTALSPNKAKIPAKSLRAMLEPEPDEEAARTIGLEVELVALVLKDHFNGGKHLMRFGKTWWFYRHGVWLRTEDDLVENRVYRTLKRVTAGNAAQRIADLLQESERGDYLNSLAAAVYGNLRRHSAKHDEVSDPLGLRGQGVKSVINCTNGELWFSADGRVEFAEHDPAHNLTFQIGTEYHSDATCPKFEAALKLVFGKCREPEEVIRHWLEVMGTVIQPKRPQAMWCLMKGPGENGKTFLVEIIEAVMGKGACLKGSIEEVASSKNPHFTASLVGKLAFVDDDVKKGVLLPDDWLKKLSEEKILTANPKNAGTFEFTCRATMIMLANHWPRTNDTSHGMKRRAHVFETSHRLTDEEKTPGLKDAIIEEELPGVLNLLIAGWLRFLQRGHYLRPAEVVEAGERWIRSANTTATFFGEMLVPKTGAPAIKLTTVYEAYKAWMETRAGGASVIGYQGFKESLQNEGIDIFTRHNQHHVRGVVLRIHAPADNEEGDGAVDPVAEGRAEAEARAIIDQLRGSHGAKFDADADFGD